MNPSDINEYDTALNMYRYLTNQRGMSDADAQAYIRQNLSSVNRAAVSSNTMANAAPRANSIVDATPAPQPKTPTQAYLGTIGNPVDPEDQYASERERLMRFYSEHDPANATALVNAELGRRKAEQMFADAKSKIPTVAETAPKSELGRRIQSLVNVGGLYSSTPEEQAKIRQGKILDLAKGQIQSSTLEAGAKNLTPEQYADQKAQNLSAYDFLTRVQQGRATPGGTGTAPAYGDNSPSAPSASGVAPVYDYDEHSVPKDFDTWGRKIIGPSAATSSMDAPANAVGFAKQVLASTKNPDRTAVTAIPAMPVRRPDAIGQLPGATSPQQESIFSRIFSAPKDPYAGQSAAQLMKTANENPDSAAAFFRADKALQKEQPDMFKPQAEKRGGSVSGGKDAALHKALEIIHHMLTRGH